MENRMAPTNLKKIKEQEQQLRIQGLMIDELMDGIQECLVRTGKRPAAILIPEIEFNMLVGEQSKYCTQKGFWTKQINGVNLYPRRETNSVIFCETYADIEFWDMFWHKLRGIEVEEMFSSNQIHI